TDLDATERNETAANRLEAAARQLVLDGRESELKVRPKPFNDAADAFVEWCKGEYRDHPNSWKRIRASMTSLKEHFGPLPLNAVRAGRIEDYKTVRRTQHEVREVTIRHDLHALSLLFQYGKKQGWCKGNPVEEVDIPSDEDAVRMHVLTLDEEKRY